MKLKTVYCVFLYKQHNMWYLYIDAGRVVCYNSPAVITRQLVLLTAGLICPDMGEMQVEHFLLNGKGSMRSALCENER